MASGKASTSHPVENLTALAFSSTVLSIAVLKVGRKMNKCLADQRSEGSYKAVDSVQKLRIRRKSTNAKMSRMEGASTGKK